jgi:hypothetical protein
MLAPHPLADTEIADAFARATGRNPVEAEQDARRVEPVPAPNHRVLGLALAARVLGRVA